VTFQQIEDINARQALPVAQAMLDPSRWQCCKPNERTILIISAGPQCTGASIHWRYDPGHASDCTGSDSPTTARARRDNVRNTVAAFGTASRRSSHQRQPK